MNIIPGARFLESGQCRFAVWAPFRQQMALKIVSPVEAVHPMDKDPKGYWSVTLDNITPGTRYFYRIDGVRDRPDPASHLQPNGVHEASEVVNHRTFAWTDSQWRGVDLEATVFYEVHVGTFTPEGTFEAIIPRLEQIRDTGITTLELMPVSQFPGARNWGYDGAYPYAVQNSYGGPEGFKRLIDAAHQRGLAVILDVVYNHFGPEGSYIGEYGPYFTEEYKTPWGNAINFDGPMSDEVRTYFIQNALHWFDHYHLDGLRFDAIHSIYDTGAQPFLRSLTEAVDRREAETGRRFLTIAETDLNDTKVIRPRELYGLGMDGQWSDDLHHAMQTLLKTEPGGYYVDFGKVEHLAKAYTEGFVYSGQFSLYRKKRFGNNSRAVPGRQFVACIQNHDQVGNRLQGDRISTRLSREAQKLASGIILLAPYVPLLFMGDEYAEEAPFTYFVSHSDSMLLEAIRKGRKQEFAAFLADGEPLDPEAEGTFLMSKLHWEQRTEGWHGVMLAYTQELLRMRRELAALRMLNKDAMTVLFSEAERTMTVRRWDDVDSTLALFNLADHDSEIRLEIPAVTWTKVLDSADARWLGPGGSLAGTVQTGAVVRMSPCSVAVYTASGAGAPTGGQ